MKKLISIAAVLLLVGMVASAQELGAIRGKVVDEDGTPLPGVSVTLTGSKIAMMSSVTSEAGNFRFLSLPVADDYMLKLELSGFKTVTREQLNVSYGRDISLNVTMEQTTLEEEITVIGQTPVIDTKRTQVGVNVTEEMIMSLPTARNPWVIMSLVPGMLIEKEDVGGNEAGQQYDYSGHGSQGRDQTWNIDGANITDNSALGSAPAYLNLASYEELQINYGNNDVKSQTGGVQLNFVSKRGGNKFSGTFYLDVEDERWQSYNGTDELEDLYDPYNPGIQRVYLYGANFGGPIVRDKAWFYGSYGIQDLHARNIDGSTDDTWLVSGYGKLNFQITPSTRAELFMEYDNKNKWNRIPWFAEAAQMDVTLTSYAKQDGPGYVWKGELEQMFGNLYLNAKAIYLDMAFYLHPHERAEGQPLTLLYYPSFYATGAADDYGTSRTNLNVNLTGNYFAEEILGGDHEIKFGVDYLVSTVTSYDYYEGNAYLYYYGPDDWFPTGEYWEASIQRDLILSEWLQRYSLFIQDTATFGKLTINLGLRYDTEKSKVKDEIIPESTLLPHLLPGLNITEIDPGRSWSILSPRLSFIYDITGDGKNVFKLSLARYGSQEGFGMGHFLNPADWAGIGVYWQDLNGDGNVANDELFGEDDSGNLAQPVTAENRLWKWGGINIENPTSTDNGNRIDSDFNSPLLDELTASFEKELFTDFAARAEFFYKKAHNGIWDRPMTLDGTVEPLFSDANPNYVDTGDVEPETGQPIYELLEDYNYEYRTNYEKRHTKYFAGQLVLIKRLSNRWMLDASVTYSQWKRYYEGEYTDPHNIWHFDEGVDSNMNSRWQFKASGLYQFPFGINASFVFRAREGYVIQPYAKTYRPGLGNSTFYQDLRGDERLPNFYMLDFRLEKVFQIGESSRVVVSMDAFNALNNNHILDQETYLEDQDSFGKAIKILNPRVFRFGVRFDF
ncbi:MAG: TonB-dependent receptor [Candidatus Aminicenantes bacterium]|nr:MAG: TonB-dependent receptor [Candidatus Aminicenantes bacterium]